MPSVVRGRGPRSDRQSKPDRHGARRANRRTGAPQRVRRHPRLNTELRQPLIGALDGRLRSPPGVWTGGKMVDRLDPCPKALNVDARMGEVQVPSELGAIDASGGIGWI